MQLSRALQLSKFCTTFGNLLSFKKLDVTVSTFKNLLKCSLFAVNTASYRPSGTTNLLVCYKSIQIMYLQAYGDEGGTSISLPCASCSSA